MKQLARSWLPTILATSLVALLALKYFWTLFLFPEVPFGYDAGIYRYLFTAHAHGFPPFAVTALPEWAKAHALGLFFFSSILVRIGVSPDMLIGWVWNAFPVLLSLFLASSVRRRFGLYPALCVLLVALLSPTQEQGFLMMYWKVFASFAFCIFAFDAFEKRKPTWVLFGMLVIATHQQIGLIFALAILSSIIASYVANGTTASLLKDLGYGALTLVLGLLWYIPISSRAILDLLPKLIGSGTGILVLCTLLFCIAACALFLKARPKHGLRIVLMLGGALLLCLLPLTLFAPRAIEALLHHGADTVPGVFFGIIEYVELSFPILILAIVGLYHRVRADKTSPWLWALVWSTLAVISMFFFYKRFLLPLDFFLLPYAAYGLFMCFSDRDAFVRVLSGACVLAQAVVLVFFMRGLDPLVSPAVLKTFQTLSQNVPARSRVIVLDNMAPWVQGYLTDSDVYGPGIFNSLSLDDWEHLLYGTHADRQTFIEHYPRGTYYFATDVFRLYYPPEVQTLLTDPCLVPTKTQGLFTSVCGDIATMP